MSFLKTNFTRFHRHGQRHGQGHYHGCGKNNLRLSEVIKHSKNQ